MLVADPSDAVQAFFKDVVERARLHIEITPAKTGP